MKQTKYSIVAYIFLYGGNWLASAQQKPVFKLLYDVPNDGTAGASTTIFEVSPGLFYGLSLFAIPTQGGSIYSITSSGSLKTIYGFPPQNTAYSLVQASDGLIWSDYHGGTNKPGYYVSMSPNGSNVLTYPTGKLGYPGFVMTPTPPLHIYDIDDPVVDQTYIFVRLDQKGNITPLHEFSGSDGIPLFLSPMVRATDGNFYGIATFNYSTLPAWLYRLTPSGEFTKIYQFATFPSHGNGVPIAAGLDGNIYGAVDHGGTNNRGEIFRITPAGQFDTIASFPATGMDSPQSITQFADGNFYGSTTTNPSYIFRLNMATNQIEGLYSMTSGQGQCVCDLVEGMDGKIYGVASRGGMVGSGTIFSINIGLPKPLPMVTQVEPASGAAGTPVVLWGQYLLGATSVQFNGGPPQRVRVTSAQSAWVKVPTGATSGPITITTANGSYTTTTSFVVQ